MRAGVRLSGCRKGQPATGPQRNRETTADGLVIHNVREVPNMTRLTGATLIVLGVFLLVWGVAHFNSPPVFVSDSLLARGRYDIGQTRLQTALGGGIVFLWWGWILFTREKRLKNDRSARGAGR